MTIKTLEEREREARELAKQQAEAYAAEQRAVAADQRAAIDARYGKLKDQAVKDYTASAEQTAEQYQSVFDANAVDELVARRHAAEAIANSNLGNSGLNSTQQTAISLSRQRADRETAKQRQAAVDSIMSQLDALKTEYTVAADQEKASIDTTMNSNIASFTKSAEQQALENASTTYNADIKAQQEWAREQRERADAILKYMNDYGYTEEEAAAIYDGTYDFGASPVSQPTAMPEDVRTMYETAKALIDKGANNPNMSGAALSLYNKAKSIVGDIDREYSSGGNVNSNAYKTSYGQANAGRVQMFVSLNGDRQRFATSNTSGYATYEEYVKNVITPKLLAMYERGQLTDSDFDWLTSYYGVRGEWI